VRFFGRVGVGVTTTATTTTSARRRQRWRSCKVALVLVGSEKVGALATLAVPLGSFGPARDASMGNKPTPGA
jgi:hypothetical protein